MKTKICFLFGILAACSSGPEVDSTKPEHIKPVKFAFVSNSGGFKKVSFNGSTQSGSETKLSFRTSGLITQLNVKVGDRVKKGMLLAKIDQQDAKINLEKSKANLSSSTIQLETAKSNLQRIKSLYQSNSASLNDYEQAKSSFANARTNYETTLKTVELQNSQFAFGKIIAPTNGVISAVNAEKNEFAQAGSPILIMNSNEGDIEANVGVPAKYISKIRHGDTVSVDINNTELLGIITEVGYSSANAATYPVIAKLVNPGKSIKPSMTAKVTFSFGTKSNNSEQLVVPVEGIMEDETGHFTFVLSDKDSVLIATKRKIKIGLLTNDGFVVHEGLDEGEMIATAGLNSLFDGRKVRLLK